MNIVVAIKQVLDPSAITVNRRAGRITVSREEYVMDPAAKNALEAALRLKDAIGQVGSERERGETAQAAVIALTVGPERADDALCEALGMGADRAIRVQDSDAARSALADAAVAARTLAQAVERIGGVDLVFVGERALDTDDGQVGPRVAESLGWPLLSRALRVEVSGRTLRIVKRAGDAYVVEEADLPALITVPPDSHPPRYAHAGRLLEAYREAQIERWSLADLGIDEASLGPLAQMRGPVIPPERQLGARLAGTAQETAVELASQLYSRLGLGR